MASPVRSDKKKPDMAVDLPDTNQDVDSLLPELPDYRAEPFFTAEKAGNASGSLLDPELGASFSDQMATSQASSSPAQAAPAVDAPKQKKAVASKKKVTRRPQVGKAQESQSQAQLQSQPQPQSQPQQASACLDRDVPVLMSVEQLGCEEAEAAMEPLRASDDLVIPDVMDTVAVEEPAYESEPIVDALDEAADQDVVIAYEAPVSEEVVELEDVQTEDAAPRKSSDLVLFADDNAERLSDRSETSVVLVIHVLSKDPTGFYGPKLLRLFKECDLRYGQEGIFHRYEEAKGRGPIQFSIAQMVEPGVFDPNMMEEQHFVGLTFFMGLPGPRQSMDAFRAMSELAQFMAQYLGAELKDDSHSVLGEQTLEHYRQQIMDYERQQQLARKVAATRR
ncbi:MAG: cell division protein ZipA C-terminal FtsZ-binding domain-containing protein [Oceanobacter sp.]